MKAFLSAQAKRDIAQAVEWYAAKEDGLGDRFLDHVAEAMESIERNPKGYAVVFDDMRRCSVPKFPYALWFFVKENALVVACLHSKRNPALAKERAMGIVQLPKRDFS